MNQAANSQQQTLNCKTPIKVLSIISLVFTVLGSISWFLNYLSGWIEYVISYGADIDDIFGFILFFLICISLTSPIILFNIYIFKLFKKPKAWIVLLIVFVLYAAARVVGPFLGLRNNIGIHLLSPAFGYTLSMYIIEIIIIVIPFVLITISALKGFDKKALLVVGISIMLFLEALNFIVLCNSNILYYYYHYHSAEVALQWVSDFLCSITFYIALLLFGLKNKIPAVIPSKAKNINKFNPTQALRALKNDFELGIITKEEYQARRAEILSKL